jgi:hypothetical protein
MSVCSVSTLKISSLNMINLDQFMVPYSNDFKSNLEPLLKVIYYWEKISCRI